MKMVLVAALVCSCKGDGSTGGNPLGASPAPIAAKRIPANLVGEWKFEQLGDAQCDDSGRCIPTIARRERLTLTADAKFEYSLYAESNFPPCKLVGQAQGRGTANVTGAKLELLVAEGFSKKQDSCGKSFDNSEKGNTWTYTFVLAADGTLMLTNDEGTQIGPYKRS